MIEQDQAIGELRIAINARMLFGQQLDGIGRLSLEVIRRLAAMRRHDHIVCIYDRKHSIRYDLGPNVQHLVVGPPARHPLLWKFWFDWQIPKVLRKLKADCFVSLDGFNTASKAIPTIIIGHDIAPLHFPGHMRSSHRHYFQKYLPRFLHDASAIVANSNFTKNDIIDTLNVSQKKIIVAHSGRNKAFVPRNEKEQRATRKNYTNGFPYFIFTGTRSPRKNLVRLLQAFEIFKKVSGYDHRLIIVGRPGWKDDEFQKTLRQSLYQREILLLEKINNDEIVPLVGAAEASVFVSLYEGFGLPVVEAMSCSIPVICSQNSAMSEVAEDAALYVDPYNIDAIAKTMIEVVENVALRDRLIKAGAVQCQKFDWNDQAQAISQLIDNLV